ncbi:MAG: LamG domain-containing protein, partial [Candidatus Omnitrophica bacterium]|nr:LamG domain-containing protein [Candidatus Omnitrophota bacterium]
MMKRAILCLIIILAAPVFSQTLRSSHFTASVGGYFEYPVHPRWDQSLEITVEAWVCREDSTRTETIVSHDITQSWWMGFAGGALRFYRSGSFVDGTIITPEGQWTHVAVSYDGAKARFYVDGEFDTSKSLENDGSGKTGPLYIGGDPFDFITEDLLGFKG